MVNKFKQKKIQRVFAKQQTKIIQIISEHWIVFALLLNLNCLLTRKIPGSRRKAENLFKIELKQNPHS